MADDVKLCTLSASSQLDKLVSLPARQQESPVVECSYTTYIQQGSDNEYDQEIIRVTTVVPQLTKEITTLVNVNSLSNNDSGLVAPQSENITESQSQTSDPDKIMRRVLTSIFRELKSYSVSNMEYFQNGKQSYHARLQVAFSLLCEHIDSGIEPQLDVILPNLSNYDVCPEIPANGYRSLLMVIQKCCLHLLQLCRHITVNRDSVLFRIVHYARELECYVTVLGQLRACLYFSCQLMAYCQKDSLFIDKDTLRDPIAFKLLAEFDSLNQDCFYGRCLGFQFCESMRKPLLCVVVALASFSEGYHETNNLMKFACSVLSSGKYLLDPELRARQVVHVAKNADIQFLKAFWSLLETDISSGVTHLVSSCNKSVVNVLASIGTSFVQLGTKVMSACVSHLPLLSGFMVQVNSIISLPPITIDLPATNLNEKRTVHIKPPSVYTGPSAVQFRLMSSDLLEGQEILLKDQLIIRLPTKTQQPSSSLLFHIHGGGFVSQSSKSHEVYLRQWAHDLKVPIVSVDYSLAPENPFPRALEECFYVYAWVLKNPEQVGWTGERICFAGDSAGGNLVLAVTLRAIDSNIRIPDGILGIYASVLISWVPSPSRLLSVMDPLLPVGIMLKCLEAYIGTAEFSSDYGSSSDKDSNNIFPKNKELSDNHSQSLIDNQKLDLESRDLENNIHNIRPDLTDFLQSDLDNLFSPDESRLSPDYKTPPRDLPIKSPTNEDVYADAGSWDDICDIVMPQTIITESENIVFTRVSKKTSNSPLMEKFSILKQKLKFSPDSGISLNDSQSKSGDLSFVSEPNLITKSPDSTPSSLPNHMIHSISTPTLHTWSDNTDIRPPHRSSFDPTNVQSTFESFLKLPVIKNPLVSPIHATDEQLQMFPEISLVTCHFDPLLDDSVMLCKRLRQMGKIADLTVLEDLPHGFLNFALVSKDARQGSNVCVAKLRKLLRIS